MQAKGRLQLQLDDSAMEAALIFVPDEENGSLWNRPKIENLLEEKGVVSGIAEGAIDEALSAFAEAEEKQRFVIAQGESPQPEEQTFAWEECPVPEELSEAAERVLSTAPPPEITLTRSARQKVRKKVQKKSNLPFVKPKEEIVERWETKKWEEPVEVDPTVDASGWVEEGQLLAVKEKRREARSGLSVYGKRVAAAGDEKEQRKSFYPGRGVREDKEGLYALYSGFLRRGPGWAEVIPFQRHSWELSESSYHATCYLTFTPGEDSAPPPSGETIRNAARERGHPEAELLPADELERLIRSAVKSGAKFEGEPITVAADGWYEIAVSEDRLRATLSMRKGSAGGTPLSLKEVAGDVKKRGFKGLDFEKLKKDLLAFRDSTDRELRDYLLAEGQAPGRAPDRSLEFTCDFVSEKERERLREVAERNTDREEYPSLEEFPLAAVQRMAKVKRETIVAELSPRETGDPGEDVYGKSLEGLPGREPASQHYEHLLRKDDHFSSELDGVLDVGDLAPQAPLASEEPQASEESEESEAQAAQASGEGGETEGAIPGGYRLRVRRHKDALVQVELDKDAMQAFLSLERAEGCGEVLSLERVSRELEQAGVVKGINSAAVSNALEKAKAGEEVKRHKVAEGIPAIDPGRSRLKFAVRRASGKSYTLREDGKADYKQQDHITTVEKDQLIGYIVSSDTSPKDGWTVRGTTLPAKEPPPLSLEIGENIRQEEGKNGSINLYAEQSGELYYDQKRIRVHTVHTVEKDVDLSTGNIKFPGEVQVRGSVTRGFYVMAGSNVKIAGNIEGALVSSGETVTVMQGIVGGEKAVVRAKQDIQSGFAEQATLLAVGDVKMKNSCLRCTIKCNGTVKLSGGKGELVGGDIQSRRGLVAEQLGNGKHVPTRISFGQDYLVFDQIRKQEREVEKVKARITALDGKMRELEKRGKRKELDTVRGEKLKLMKQIEKRSMHLFSLRERYEEHFESRVAVRGTVYPGVVLESHGRFLEITREMQGVAFTFDQETGRIVEHELNKE